MAEVPYVPYPTKESTSASGAMLSVPNANAEAFGAGVGAAMQHLGAVGNQAADQIGQEVLKFQNLQNETDANNLLMDATEQLGQEKVKLQSLEGQAAVDYLPAYNANVQKIRQDFLSKSGNPMVEHMLDLQLTRTSKYALIDGAGHAGTQAKKALAASRAGTIGQAAANAADADELSFQDSLRVVTATVNSELSDQHVDLNSDQAKQYRAQQIGQLWQNRISTKSMTDPYAAKQMLDKIPAEQMTPDVRLAATKVIESNAINVGARNIANATNPSTLGNNAPTAVKYQHGLNYFMQQGWSREQAIGLMNNLTHESGGNLSPTAINPHDAADGSASVGIGQWNMDRKNNLYKFAQNNNLNANDFDTQLKFTQWELTHTHTGAAAALKATTNSNDATTVVTKKYEVAGIEAIGNRIAFGTKYANLQNVPDPTSPQKMNSAQIQQWEDAARKRAEEQFPGDPRVADAAVMRVRQQVSQSDQVATRYQREQQASIDTALMGGPDGKGKLPTNRDELFQGNPDMVRSFNVLTPEKQRAVDKTLEQNAKGITVRWDSAGVRRTRYNELVGMANSDPDAFHDVQISSEDLPAEAKNKLFDLQQNPPKQGNQGITSALTVLQRTGFLEQAGIDPKVDPATYHQFAGALSSAIENWHAANPRHQGPIPDDAVLKMMPELVKEVPNKNQGMFARAREKLGLGSSTSQAFQVEPDAAAQAAVGATKTIEQQLAGSGIPMIVVTPLRDAYYKRFGKLPNAEEIKTMYFSSQKLMTKYPFRTQTKSVGEVTQ